MVNKLLAYAIMLDSLIAVYVQFVIMLMELKKVLSQVLKCLFVDYHSLIRINNYGCESYIFNASEINKYFIEMYVYCV